MSIYLINLDRDEERLAHMRAQLAGLAFERVTAVDARKLSEVELEALRTARPLGTWSPGQLGCLLSHYGTWQAIAAGKDAWGLVLEDDLHLSKDFADFAQLPDFAGFPGDADIVRLEAPNNAVRLGPPVLTHEGRTLRAVRSSTWCAGAYLISRTAAQRLIELDPKTHLPADYFLFSFEESPVPSMLKIYQLTPAVAIQDKFSNPQQTAFASNIETGPPEVEPMGAAVFFRKAMRVLKGYRRVTVR